MEPNIQVLRSAGGLRRQDIGAVLIILTLVSVLVFVGAISALGQELIAKTRFYEPLSGTRAAVATDGGHCAILPNCLDYKNELLRSYESGPADSFLADTNRYLFFDALSQREGALVRCDLAGMPRSDSDSSMASVSATLVCDRERGWLLSKAEAQFALHVCTEEHLDSLQQHGYQRCTERATNGVLRFDQHGLLVERDVETRLVVRGNWLANRAKALDGLRESTIRLVNGVTVIEAASEEVQYRPQGRPWQWMRTTDKVAVDAEAKSFSQHRNNEVVRFTEAGLFERASTIVDETIAAAGAYDALHYRRHYTAARNSQGVMLPAELDISIGKQTGATAPSESRLYANWTAAALISLVIDGTPLNATVDTASQRKADQLLAVARNLEEHYGIRSEFSSPPL